LNSRPEFTKIEHNLRNAEGIYLFKDRNVIAVFATDNEIPYTEIPTVKTMREEYIKVREQDEVEWRAQAYHTFRCEQEIWNIERARVQETDTIDVPLTSGTYYRLLDEPERRLFRQVAVIRGGFTLEALEEIVAAGAQQPTPTLPNTLELLSQLVDKSLVIVERQAGHLDAVGGERDRHRLGKSGEVGRLSQIEGDLGRGLGRHAADVAVAVEDAAGAAGLGAGHARSFLLARWPSHTR
jgi:hypothetical protein